MDAWVPIDLLCDACGRTGAAITILQVSTMGHVRGLCACPCSHLFGFVVPVHSLIPAAVRAASIGKGITFPPTFPQN